MPSGLVGHFKFARLIASSFFKFQANGRIAVFWCEDGWTLAPSSEKSVCKLGQWDKAIPNCVRAGCESIGPIPSSHRVTYDKEMNGALLRFRCSEEGYVLQGEPVVSCDGDRWNSSAPFCEPAPSTTTTRNPPKTTNSVITRHDESEKLTSSSTSRTTSCFFHQCAIFLLAVFMTSSL